MPCNSGGNIPTRCTGRRIIPAPVHDARMGTEIVFGGAEMVQIVLQYDGPMSKLFQSKNRYLGALGKGPLLWRADAGISLVSVETVRAPKKTAK